jgi:uncharacterized protein YukE/uncharacterized C2H2 Zn-finger protein
MTNNTCPYCKKIFSSRSNLQTHINTAKYCLQKRNTCTPIKKKMFYCEDCKHEFTTKQSLLIHENICLIRVENKCTIKYQKIIDETAHTHQKIVDDLTQQIRENKEHYEKELTKKDEHIQRLEKQLENIALKAVSRHTIQNNNRIQTINNLLPITNEHLKEQVNFLSRNHIEQGNIGYSQYFVEYPIKNRVVCVDFARRKVKYKNEEGIVLNDPEMTSLLQKLFSVIKDKNEELCKEYMNDLCEVMKNTIKNSSEELTKKQTNEFDKEVEKINNMIIDVRNQIRQINDIVEGKKPNLFHEVLRDVCSKTKYENTPQITD